jgi:hypothetical protein
LSDGVSYDFNVYACVTVDKKAVKDDDVAAISLETTRNLSAPKTASAKLFNSPDAVRFTWSSVNYATSYQVSYKASSEKSYTYLGEFTGTEAVAEGLKAGTSYTFKVVPCTYVNGETFADSSSKTASVTTLKQISTPTVKKSSSTKVKISWKNIGGETGYQISVSADPEGTEIASTYKTTSGKNKTLTVTKGEALCYKVRAYTVVDGEYIYGEWVEGQDILNAWTMDGSPMKMVNVYVDLYNGGEHVSLYRPFYIPVSWELAIDSMVHQVYTYMDANYTQPYVYPGDDAGSYDLYVTNAVG